MGQMNIQELPDSIILKIFEFLSQDDLRMSVRDVCLSWQNLYKDPSLWRMIDLSTAPEIVNDDMLTQILTEAGTFIQYLNLDKCEEITGVSFLQPDVEFPVLKGLNLSLTEVDDEIMRQITARFPGINDLNVVDCLMIKDLISIINSLPSLKSLSFSMEEGGDIGSLSILLSRQTSLQKLEIIDTFIMRDVHLEMIVENLNLTHLSLSGCCNVGDEGIFNVAKCLSQLRSLNISETAITDKGIKVLAQSCPFLEEVNTSICGNITDIGLADVTRFCLNLTRLYVNTSQSNMANLTDVGLTDIAINCKRLRVLSMCSCPQASEKGIRQLALNCPELEVLDVSQCLAITDPALFALASRSKYLRVFKAAGCLQLTAGKFQNLDPKSVTFFHVYRHFWHIREILNTGIVIYMKLRSFWWLI